MKKLALLFGLTILGCSDDNEREEICENRLWGLTENCGPDPNVCVYFATFGESEESAGTVEVDQSTYNHYLALGNTTDGSLCWQGTQ